MLAFTGTFVDLFYGHLCSSRTTIFEISKGTVCTRVPKKPSVGVHGQFRQVQGQFFLKMFMGTFEYHGHFMYCSKAFFGFAGNFNSKR